MGISSILPALLLLVSTSFLPPSSAQPYDPDAGETPRREEPLIAVNPQAVGPTAQPAGRVRNISTYLHITMRRHPTRKGVNGEAIYLPVPVRSISPVVSIKITGAGDVHWRGFGTTLGWFANFIGGYPNPYHSRLMDLLFSPVQGMGLNIVRYVVPGGFNPRHTDVLQKYHAQATRGFRPSPLRPYDWTADANQRTILVGAVRRGAIADAVSYSPPFWMTVSQDTFGSHKPNLAASHYIAYADYVTEVMGWYKKVWNVSFAGVDPFNEPFQPLTKDNLRQEKCIFTVDQVAPVLQAFNLALVRKRLVGARLVGVDDWFGNSLQAFVSEPKLAFLLDRVAVHGYHDSTPLEPDVLGQLKEINKLRKAYKKEVWVSEWRIRNPLPANVGSFGRAMFMARQMVDMINNAGAAAFIHHQAITPPATGASSGPPTDGLITMPFNYRAPFRPQLTPSFHVQQLIAQAIRPGAKILAVAPENSRLTVVAYEAGTRLLSFVVVNELTSTILLSVPANIDSQLQFISQYKEGVYAVIRRCTMKENNHLAFKGVLAPSMNDLKGIKVIGRSVTSIVLHGILAIQGGFR